MIDRVSSRPLPVVSKPATVNDLGAVDVTDLIALVERCSDRLWQRENDGKENDFPVFNDTQHIILRFIEQNHDPRTWYERPAWRLFSPVVEPVLVDLAARLGLVHPRFPKAMFARVPAGTTIDRHVDGAGSNPRVHKVHVPLITDPRVMFEVAGERFHLEVGRAYEVNNLQPHAVYNDAMVSRTHLIFEAYSDGSDTVSDTSGSS